MCLPFRLECHIQIGPLGDDFVLPVCERSLSHEGDFSRFRVTVVLYINVADPTSSLNELYVSRLFYTG